MIKNVMKRVWAFDIEWIPDPIAGRILYDLSEDTRVEDVMKVMWERGGATEEDPTPFLKTAVCRVVSVAALERRDWDVETRLIVQTFEHDSLELLRRHLPATPAVFLLWQGEG